jgi:oxygen-independent coproporphyrinogen-3 oxidase
VRARAEQDGDRAADLYALADERLSAGGLHWYELSNWARPGAQSRHNLAYWQRLPYEGLGPGAHAFDGDRTRRWNAAQLEGYVEALGGGEEAHAVLPPGGRETLSDRDVLVERAMLALRTSAGIDPALAGAAEVAPAIEWAEEHGLLEPAERGDTGTSAPGGRSHRRLTARGRMLSNELFVRFL